MNNIKGKILGASGSLTGSLSFLGSYQVCHNACLALVAFLTFLGFAVAGMPLLFLTKLQKSFIKKMKHIIKTYQNKTSLFGNSIMLKNIKLVYSNEKYLLLSLVVALVTFIGLYYLTFYFTTLTALRFMEGEFYFYFTFASNFIISALFGFNASAIVSKIHMKSKIAKDSSFSGGGVIAGAFASGCPVCGSLLLPLIGISGGLATFPFRGLELKALAVSLMLVSTYFILKNYNKCDSCENSGVKD